MNPRRPIVYILGALAGIACGMAFFEQEHKSGFVIAAGIFCVAASLYYFYKGYLAYKKGQ